MLGTIDIIIAAYFATLLIIGYFSSKKQTSEDYLIAKRNLGTGATMATVNASKTGSIIITFVAMTYLWVLSNMVFRRRDCRSYAIHTLCNKTKEKIYTENGTSKKILYAGRLF